jgi:hypothetical protein
VSLADSNPSFRSRTEVAWQRHEPGWYLIDKHRGEPVAGPFDKELTASQLLAGAHRWRVSGDPTDLVLTWLHQ